MAWLVLLMLLVAQGVALWWWLRKEYLPLFFSGWAALLYSLVLAADFIIMWLVSTLEEQGGTIGASALAACGVGLVIIVFLGTLFFRWVVRHDMTDIPGSRK